MSIASQGKSNAATAESETKLVDPLFDIGNFWDDRTRKELDDAASVDEESTTLRTDLSQDTLKTFGNPLDQLLDLVGACLGVEDVAFNFTSDDAVCADLAPCLPDTKRITSQRATNDRTLCDEHPTLDETKDETFINFLVSGGFKPASGTSAIKNEHEPQKAVSRSVEEQHTDEVKAEPAQTESMSPDIADEVEVSTCVGSSERSEGVEVEYPSNVAVEDPENVEKPTSHEELIKRTVWDDKEELGANHHEQLVEEPPVSENLSKETVWNDQESFEEVDDAEITSPSPGVKVMSLGELAYSNWVFQPHEKDEAPSHSEIQADVEDMVPAAQELKAAATNDTAPDDERATFSASGQCQEQEMTEREADTSKTTTRTEAIRSFISKKAAGVEATKAAKAETRRAKLEKREVLKKEKARRREAAKVASKSVSTTLLGGSLPLKLGRIEKKNNNAEALPKSHPTTTNTKAAPVRPGAVIVGTNPVLKTVVVEHSPRDIVERTVTFEDDQVSVIERREGRDTQETTMKSTIAAAATAAVAPDNKVPALPPVDPPSGRPKMRIIPPNAWIKQSSAGGGGGVGGSSSSMASWLGSHLSTEEPELSTLEQKGSWLEEHQQQKQRQQQQNHQSESIE